jgi:hypothetical protein
VNIVNGTYDAYKNQYTVIEDDFISCWNISNLTVQIKAANVNTVYNGGKYLTVTIRMFMAILKLP